MKNNRGDRGVTLTELMVSMAILTVGAMSFIGGFTYIAKAIETHRTRTLATNLSQEQIEFLKNQSYFQIIPSSVVLYNYGGSNFNPPVPYDAVVYAPTVVAIGNSRFIRLTYVERINNSAGVLTNVPFDSLDTGIKRITITTIWQLGPNWFKTSVTNLVSSLQQSGTGGFQGTVTDPSGVPIPGADIFAQSDSYYHDFADASGRYAFSVSPGAFTIKSSAAGFIRWTSSATYSIPTGYIQTLNITLVPISSASVSGSVWVNPDLVISQVVVDTFTYVHGHTNWAQQDVEYVQLFNPTTSAFNIGVTGQGYWNVSTGLWYYAYEPTLSVLPLYAYDYPLSGYPYFFNTTFISTSVAPGHYYLYSNVDQFMWDGQWVTADAVFDPQSGNVPPAHFLSASPNWSGFIGIMHYPKTLSFTFFDNLRWDSATYPQNPNYWYGFAGPISTNSVPVLVGTAPGAPKGQQIVRLSTPTYTLFSASMTTNGWAYDTGYNKMDFSYSSPTWNLGAIPPYHPWTVFPWSTQSGSFTVLSGVPAYGAVVTANDGQSASTIAYRTQTAGGQFYSTFTLVGIATGTWTVEIDSGLAMLSLAGVAVSTPGVTYGIPNSSTTPTWISTPVYSNVLTVPAVNGIVSGNVSDPNGNPLVNMTVDVEPSGLGVTDANGNFNIPSLGTCMGGCVYSVAANPPGVTGFSPVWSNQTITNVTVNAGQINNGNNFVLSGAGQIRGYVCAATAANPLPRVVLVAFDAFGNAVGQTLSGTNGMFAFNNLSTGTYTVEPILDAKEFSTPSGLAASIVAGSNVSVGTFTVSGAYGYVAGQVTFGGAPITTGALIVATTSTIAGAMPPAYSSGTLLAAPYYMVSSPSNSFFNLPVRVSTASARFNVYGWYTTFAGQTPTTTKKTYTITVTGGQTTTQNISWP